MPFREKVHCDFGVRGGRRANDHRVERSLVSQLLPRTECLAAQGFGGAGRRLEANVGHRRDLRLFEPSEDLNVGLGDPAGADQPECKGVAHARTPARAVTASVIASAR